MKVRRTDIAGVFVVEAAPIDDERGSFERLFCVHELEAVLGGRRIVQINRSVTRSVGTIRGIHYQRAPFAEMKLVRCLRGRVWDVAVDLRAGSATLLRWHAEELSPGACAMLVIPEGCAHGFQALEPEAELLYLHTAAYSRESEGGVRFDDPSLRIDWPLPPAITSSRDLGLPFVSAGFSGIQV